MSREKRKSPRKARVARERLRGADGLFLSANGHRKSTGRYVSVNSLAQGAATAYARLDALHDHKLQLDVARIELERQKSLRKLDEKQADLNVEQQALEEKDRQARREAQERCAKERADSEQRAQAIIRAQESKAAEQREQFAEQQIDREKQLAEEQIKTTEAWVKTLTPNTVS